MGFFLVIGFYAVTLWIVARHRRAIARLFLRLPISQSGAAVVAAISFSIIEEGVLNLASGTLHVLIATVPVLTVFVLVAGMLGRLSGARSLRFPLGGLLAAGLLFEATLGGHRKGFQHPESPGTLAFGVVLTLATYAYISIVSLTIAVEGNDLKVQGPDADKAGRGEAFIG